MALFRSLVDRGVLFAVQWALGLPEQDETQSNKPMISAGGEILSALLDHDLNGVRGHVLKQVVAIEKESTAMGWIKNQSDARRFLNLEAGLSTTAGNTSEKTEQFIAAGGLGACFWRLQVLQDGKDAAEKVVQPQAGVQGNAALLTAGLLQCQPWLRLKWHWPCLTLPLAAAS